ncbi:MAG: 3-hydroxyacyl-ACP dehydratase FabZ family protein [Chitinispirillia bacterium]|jgi:3-hydroxyacyl-[acyl-carrier-protein] dehydratase
MSRTILFGPKEILAILPHRPPFLFVDYVTGFTENVMIKTERFIHEDEFFFKGHFPQKPIMPGVLVTDALAQTSGLLWGFSKQKKGKTGNNGKTDINNFLLVSVNMKYKSPSHPGDILKMKSFFKKRFGSLYLYNVEAVVKRNIIAKGEITLALMNGFL